MLSFKVFKSHSRSLAPLLFWKICCPRFQHAQEESVLQTAGDWAERAQCKAHCHLLATCAHCREAEGKGRGKATTIPSTTSQAREPMLPQQRRGKNVALGGTAEAAGALYTDGKRGSSEANLTSVMNGRGDSRRSASNKAAGGWGVP